MTVTLRPARPDEAPQLTELAVRSKGHWGSDAGFLEACRAELAMPPEACDSLHVIVAVGDDDVPLGFVRYDDTTPVGELTELYVEPATIGRGVGSRLLDHARRSAVAVGVRTLVIDADPHAEAFYLAQGAHRIGWVASGSIPGRRLPQLALPLLAPPALAERIPRFYAAEYDEAARLTGQSPHGLLEFRRTQELLRRVLPPVPATLLDVGGGPGVHARWLVADGYDVRLVDPVPEHVAAAARVTEVTATVGDARALGQPDAVAAATLALGPLYHLVDAAERATALQECVRVTRPGGLVAVAAISCYAALLEFTGRGALDDAAAAALSRFLTDGAYDGSDGFTTAYFHRPEELALELVGAGLEDVTVFGVEGPAAPALDNARPELTDAVLDSAVRCARLLETDPAMVAASPHLLAVGYRPGTARRL